MIEYLRDRAEQRKAVVSGQWPAVCCNGQLTTNS
jgi:hypothetical protein